MKKWVCACLIGGLCLLSIRISVPFDSHEGKVVVTRDKSNPNLKLALELAEKGIMKGTPLRLGDIYTDVIEGWGEPRDIRNKQGSYYASYPSKHISIGYNRFGVFELYTEHPDVQMLSTAMVLEALGAPAEVRQTKRQTKYIYRAGKYEFTILFDQATDRALSQSVYSSELKESGEYFLEVKGDSVSLTESTRNGMNKWRKEMAAFIQQYPLMLSSNGPNRKQVALTFDDGPDRTVTADILNILQQYNVKGNFFFLGSQAAAFPHIVQEAYLDGHLIGIHSFEHINLTTLNDEQMRIQIDESAHVIKSIIDKSPAIFRPPYGEMNDKLVTILLEEGWQMVLWSIDSLDWSLHTADEITENVKSYVRNGDIILLHSQTGREKTAEALPKILDYLLETGYEIVRIDEMLGIDAYEE